MNAIVHHAATGLTITVREGTSDRAVIREVLDSKVYRFDPAQVGPGGVIVDLGANIGMFTLYAAKACPSARVIAYEPEPDNLEILKLNIAQNGFDGRVTVWPFAVSDQRGRRQMTRQQGNSHLDGTYPGEVKAPRIEVETVSLAEVVSDNKIDMADFMKLDCEGSEFDVLNAPNEVVRRFRRLAMETHWFNPARWTEFVDRLSLTHHVEPAAGYLFATVLP